jgi:hypothetical protein
MNQANRRAGSNIGLVRKEGQTKFSAFRTYWLSSFWYIGPSGLKFLNLIK